MKVNNIFCQLANIRVAILDKELMNRVLTSLPSSWDIFRQLISTQEHPLSFADLESMLLHEDLMRACSRERDHEEQALSLQHEAYFTSQFQEGIQSNFRGGPRQSNFQQCPNYATSMVVLVIPLLEAVVQDTATLEEGSHQIGRTSLP